MTIRRTPPSREELVDYIYGDLEHDDARALGEWLIAFADEELLTKVERILSEKAEREAMWARIAARPLLARVKRLVAALTSNTAAIVRALEVGGAGAAPSFTRLGGSIQSPSLTLSMAPGTLDLRLELEHPAWVEAVFVDEADNIHLWLAPARFEARSTSLPGLALELADRSIDAYVVVTATAPEAEALRDDAWLAGCLEAAGRPESGVTVCHRHIRVEVKPE